MLAVRRDADIHREQGGWFDARWHFSFDRYRDPEQMGIGPLRVFNDDRLVAGADWPMHPHADVEGLTYVVEGTFEHADSLGNGGQLQPGAVQRMTLGSGALHSERNGSDTEPMRFLQFWILPGEANFDTSIEQKQFTKEDRSGQLLRVIGGDPPAISVPQDAAAYVASLEPGDEVLHEVDDGRAASWYLTAAGVGIPAGEELGTGDGVKACGPEPLALHATAASELILVEVPATYTPVGVWAGRG